MTWEHFNSFGENPFNWGLHYAPYQYLFMLLNLLINLEICYVNEVDLNVGYFFLALIRSNKMFNFKR